MSTENESSISRLKALTERARKAIANVDETKKAKPWPSKRVPFFGSETFAFFIGTDNIATPADPDLKAQERVFVNGGEDIYVTQLTYKAHTSIFGVLAPNTVTTTGTINGQWLQCSSFGSFDFEWNYRLMSTSASYLSTANGANFLSRISLGYPETGSPLEFVDPLVIRAGDALAISARMTLCPTVFAGAVTPRSFVVEVVFSGYRDGAMATAEYEVGR